MGIPVVEIEILEFIDSSKVRGVLVLYRVRRPDGTYEDRPITPYEALRWYGTDLATLGTVLVVRYLEVYILDKALRVAETRLEQSCMQSHSQTTYQAVSDARRPSMSGTCVTRPVFEFATSPYSTYLPSSYAL